MVVSVKILRVIEECLISLISVRVNFFRFPACDNKNFCQLWRNLGAVCDWSFIERIGTCHQYPRPVFEISLLIVSEKIGFKILLHGYF